MKTGGRANRFRGMLGATAALAWALIPVPGLAAQPVASCQGNATPAGATCTFKIAGTHLLVAGAATSNPPTSASVTVSITHTSGDTTTTEDTCHNSGMRATACQMPGTTSLTVNSTVVCNVSGTGGPYLCASF
ncbi:MAG: hypothetical protein ABR548_05855 [Actinomycetota bacterium]|nr:hypothetical protein [Actinomycetota bacterium]